MFDYKVCPRDGELILVQAVGPAGNWSLVFDGTDEHQIRHDAYDITGEDPCRRWPPLRDLATITKS